MSFERNVLLAVFIAGSSGCREPEFPDGATGRCDDPDVPCVELGVGPEIVPVADDEEIELVHGPQGGWHVELGVRFTGIDPLAITLVYEAHREDDGELVAQMRYGITPRRLGVDGHHRLRAEDLVIFDIDSGDQVRSRRTTFTVRIEDESGAELASDTRTLRIIDREP